VAGLVLHNPRVAVDAPLGGEPLARARAALNAGDTSQAAEIHFKTIMKLPSVPVNIVRWTPAWKLLQRYVHQQIADEAIESLGVGLGRYAGLARPATVVLSGSPAGESRRRADALAAAPPGADKVVLLGSAEGPGPSIHDHGSAVRRLAERAFG
jgi:hypothetical protein